MASEAGRNGGGGPAPKGIAGGVATLIALGGIMVVGNNALFNVDGGHRAIKYTRLGGVGKQIYSEGMYLLFPGAIISYNVVANITISFSRYTYQDPMVRDSYRL